MPRDPRTAIRHTIAATDQLDGFGIELGADAARWLKKLTELRADQPEEAPPDQVAELIANSAKPAEIDKAVAYKAGQQIRIGQHLAARQIVACRTLDAILDDRDRIHNELAAHANRSITRLHQAAALTESIIELTKARKTEEAHLLATATADAEDLKQLFHTRDTYLTPLGMQWSTGWWSCAHFQNPWEIDHPSPQGDNTLWDQWRAKIQRGGRLWYPTIEEAHAASQPHEPKDVLPPIDPRRSTVATFM